MATVAKPVAETLPLTANEVEYNKEVADLVTTLRQVASDITADMKLRQLPDGLKADKVYGANAAKRSDLNSLASVVNKVADVAEKLTKGGTKKSKDGFVGFSIPSYIKPEMAIALGLREGSLLWPQGGKPIFSAALITRFFTNRVMARGLIHSDNLSIFTSDDQMKRLFAPYTVSSVKPGESPIDLDNLTYTGIQKLIKNFVEKRSKEIPGPNLDIETENGKNLTAVFKQLEAQFKQLKVVKEQVTAALKAVAGAQKDLIKAKAGLDAGYIGQELFNSYAVAYQRILGEKDAIYATYKAQAQAMGI